MRVLGIETATSAQGVALMENERLLAEASYSAQGSRGGLLLPAVDDVLRKTGMAVQELDAVAVSVGPGSFTGLRVGVATAKGLARGSGARLIGVSTLEALAVGYEGPDGTICALLDAFRGEVYVGVFTRRGGRTERVAPDAVLAPDAVAGALAHVEAPVYVVGEGAARYREQLAASLGERAILTAEGLQAVPSAVLVARLGMAQWAGGRCHDGAVVPVYLRRVEAEVKWEQGLLKSPLARLG